MFLCTPALGFQFAQLNTDIRKWRAAAYSVAGMREFNITVLSLVARTDQYVTFAGIRTARDLAMRFAAELGSAMPTLAWRIAHPRTVAAAWAVSLSYCAVDVGTEVYDMRMRGEGHESIAVLAAERSSFHLIASVALPYVAVSQATRLARAVLHRFGAFQRVGPAIVGLCTIPMLPLLIDDPVSDALRDVFSPLRDYVSSRTRN